MKLSERMRLGDEMFPEDYADEVAQLEAKNEVLKATIRIDWEVIVDAIDDHDIKQAVIRLWNRADALLKGGDDSPMAKPEDENVAIKVAWARYKYAEGKSVGSMYHPDLDDAFNALDALLVESDNAES